MTNTILWALIALANSSITVDPGYATKAECSRAFKGGTATCISYDPDGSTWMMMFYRPTARGSIKLVRRIPDGAECQNYLGTLKPDVPAVCKQLDVPIDCDPAVSELGIKATASIAPRATANKPDTANAKGEISATAIQVSGGHYTRVGLVWVPDENTLGLRPDPNTPPLQLPKHYPPPASQSGPPSSITPLPVEVVETPRPKTVVAQQEPQRQQPGLGGSYAMQPNPFQVFIDTLMLPIDLVTYPARRDAEGDYRHDAVRHRDW